MNKSRYLLIEIVMLFLGTAYSPTIVTATDNVNDFVNIIGSQAQEVARVHDLYASVMIAQAILESASGSSQLSRAPNYNLFGIKGSYLGESASFTTNEDNGNGNLFTIQANFRKYPSYKESLEDYARLLNGSYYIGARKSQTKSYKDVTFYLTGRYATDTRYYLSLNKLIETYNLTRFDKPGKVRPFSVFNENNLDESSENQQMILPDIVIPTIKENNAGIILKKKLNKENIKYKPLYYQTETGDTIESIANSLSLPINMLEKYNNYPTHLVVNEKIRLGSIVTSDSQFDDGDYNLSLLSSDNYLLIKNGTSYKEIGNELSLSVSSLKKQFEKYNIVPKVGLFVDKTIFNSE